MKHAGSNGAQCVFNKWQMIRNGSRIQYSIYSKVKTKGCNNKKPLSLFSSDKVKETDDQ